MSNWKYERAQNQYLFFIILLIMTELQGENYFRSGKFIRWILWKLVTMAFQMTTKAGQKPYRAPLFISYLLHYMLLYRFSAMHASIVHYLFISNVKKRLLVERQQSDFGRRTTELDRWRALNWTASSNSAWLIQAFPPTWNKLKRNWKKSKMRWRPKDNLHN